MLSKTGRGWGNLTGARHLTHRTGRTRPLTDTCTQTQYEQRNHLLKQTNQEPKNGDTFKNTMVKTVVITPKKPDHRGVVKCQRPVLKNLTLTKQGRVERETSYDFEDPDSNYLMSLDGDFDTDFDVTFDDSFTLFPIDLPEKKEESIEDRLDSVREGHSPINEVQKEYLRKLCLEKKKAFPPFEILSKTVAADLITVLEKDQFWAYGDDDHKQKSVTEKDVCVMKMICDRRGLDYPNYIEGKDKVYYQEFGGPSYGYHYEKQRFERDMKRLKSVNPLAERDNFQMWPYGAKLSHASNRNFWKHKTKKSICVFELRQYLEGYRDNRRLKLMAKKAHACEVAWKFFCGVPNPLLWEKEKDNMDRLTDVVTKYNLAPKHDLACHLRDMAAEREQWEAFRKAPGEVLSIDGLEGQWSFTDYHKAGLPIKMDVGLYDYFKHDVFPEEEVKWRVKEWYMQCKNTKPKDEGWMEKYAIDQLLRYKRMLAKADEYMRLKK